MIKTVVSLLPFLVSTKAAVIIIGGGGVDTTFDDNWNAPDVTKASFAFEIIWFIVTLFQFLLIIKNFKAIPSMAGRAPYILLMVITVSLGIWQVLYAVYLRTSTILDRPTLISIYTAGTFFVYLDTAFIPAVVLYLVHQRGDILRAVRGNTTAPLATHLWKRILDWALTGLTFVMAIAAMGVYSDYLNSLVLALHRTYLDLGHAAVAFATLLCIDVFISVIVQFVQGKDTQPADLVVRRLVIAMTPLIVLYAFELLFFDIFPVVAPASTYNSMNFNLAHIIVDGIIRISITTVLIGTMTIPGVRWSTQQVGALEQVPANGGQPWVTPSSGWTQAPLNPGWNGYNPQPQQPVPPPQQQPSYYPQPHPMFLQMQQQQQQQQQQQPQYSYFPSAQPPPTQTAHT